MQQYFTESYNNTIKMLLAPGKTKYVIVIMVLNYEKSYALNVDTMNSTLNLYEPHNKTNWWFS